MNLALFIVELLWEHDCVIVPGWGGFIANYQSAKKNPITHEIFPPSRQLSFNKLLTQQDGLLQSHIAQSLSLTITESQQMIQNWVREHHQKLSNGEKIVMFQLGVFAKDFQDQIQFIPEENNTFLKSSFGLSSVQLQLTQPHKLIQPADKVQYPQTKKWMVAAGIALALGLGVFATQQSVKNIDTAGWNWLEKNGHSSYQPITPQIPDPQITLPSPEEMRNVTTLAPLVEENRNADASRSEKNQPVKSTLPKKTPAVKSKNSSWVVGGVFVNKDNAENKVQAMIKLGFSQSKVIAFEDRYYACYGVVTGDQAEINLRKKVAQVDPFAWTKR